MTALLRHPEFKIIRLQLRQNRVLESMSAAQWGEFERMVEITDYAKGASLENQGDEFMQQYFIIEGILKRVVSSPSGKEMILRVAAENEIDTSYAAWRLKTPMPYSIRAVTRARTARLPMEDWVAFIERHPAVKNRFELAVMKLMSEVMAHTITLHLLDAPPDAPLLELEVRDAIHEQAAGAVGALEHRDEVAGPIELLRTGQPRGPAAHDGHPLAGPHGRRLQIGRAHV